MTKPMHDTPMLDQLEEALAKLCNRAKTLGKR